MASFISTYIVILSEAKCMRSKTHLSASGLYEILRFAQNDGFYKMLRENSSNKTLVQPGVQDKKVGVPAMRCCGSTTVGHVPVAAGRGPVTGT